MFIQIGDITVHAQTEGPETGSAVLLMHTLGSTLAVWEPQAAALARRGFRVVRMDIRGHGLTEAPPGPYSMVQLAQDGLHLLDALGIARAHVGGISIGGRIAMGMAALAPERVLSLLPCDTALEFKPESTWQERIEGVTRHGLAAGADASLGRWVHDTALASSKGLRRMLLTTDPTGWLGCAAALRDCTKEEILGKLRCPATVIVGEQDEATPVAASAAIRDAIPGARMVTIADARHIPSLEREADFTRAVLGHFDPLEQPASRMDAGAAMRRAVLGEAQAGALAAAATPLDAPFRDWALESLWGGVWTRPGLSPRDRSLLTVGLLAALGQHEELAIHVRATRNTGVTEAELAEIILQVAGYCGVPAGNAALRVARQALQETAA
jgi:3-oxoadipate enol-lactonase / 4-carboxymuconolactone decarboxylase